VKKYLIIIIISVVAVPAQADKVFKKAENYQSMIAIKRIRKIKLPEGYHEGLLIDGDNVWVNNGEGGKTWVIDLNSGDIVSKLEPVATFSEGIFAAPGGKYWITDWDTKKLYRVKIEGERMRAEFELSLAPSRPTGIAWDGNHLYVITWTRGVTGTRYHILKIGKNGNILDKVRIKGISEPSQMAWDGKHLWVSSWFDRRVYKIDIETAEIKGYFRSGIKNLTGIAWDGKGFWLTGSKADLYQVKLVP